MAQRAAAAAGAAPPPSRARLAVAAAVIFLAALGVRLLAWADTPGAEIERVQTSVAADYWRVARLIREGGLAGFFSSTSPLADPNTLGHPPGYSVLLALFFALFGESAEAVRLFQLAADAAAAAIAFLIAAALLPRGAAVTAGLLAALAPQFVWNSLPLLPDTLASLPLLAAVLSVARAAERPRLSTAVAAGALVGLSCWLRANALLLAPFLAAALVLLLERGRRLRYALALVVGAVVVVAPLTLRNAVVFGHFVPLSLGAGQTFLEGIADYDPEGRFGIPPTDLAIIRQEAAAHNRPDYAESLFGPDGVRRERERLRRGLAVVRQNPVWFSTVLARRALSMLKLERARPVQPEPPVTHALERAADAAPAWSASPAELLAGGEVLAPGASASLPDGGRVLRLSGDDSAYAPQFASAPAPVRGRTDYLLSLPVRVERGRMTVGVLEDGARRPRVSTVVETTEGKSPEEQPTRVVQLPFASGGGDGGRVRLLFANAASARARPALLIGEARLHELGPASLAWTRYPRLLVSAAQKLFITAAMLPLALAGLALLWLAGRGRALVVLLAVPVYYFCVQSALHTEYRYVLALHYFLFMLAAVSFCRAGGILWSGARRLRAGRGSAARASA